MTSTADPNHHGPIRRFLTRCTEHLAGTLDTHSPSRVFADLEATVPMRPVDLNDD